MRATHSLNWIQVVAAVPAAVMLSVLLCWNPISRKQWLLAAIMGAYVAVYYFVFIR